MRTLPGRSLQGGQGTKGRPVSYGAQAECGMAPIGCANTCHKFLGGSCRFYSHFKKWKLRDVKGLTPSCSYLHGRAGIQKQDFRASRALAQCHSPGIVYPKRLPESRNISRLQCTFQFVHLYSFIFTHSTATYKGTSGTSLSGSRRICSRSGQSCSCRETACGQEFLC